jgi:hypothetical protein
MQLQNQFPAAEQPVIYVAMAVLRQRAEPEQFSYQHVLARTPRTAISGCARTILFGFVFFIDCPAARFRISLALVTTSHPSLATAFAIHSPLTTRP